VGRIVKAPLEHLPPGRDKDIKYFAVLWADASGIHQHRCRCAGDTSPHLGGIQPPMPMPTTSTGANALLEGTSDRKWLMWDGFHHAGQGVCP